MASVSTDPSGNRRILFVAGDGKRKAIRLGRVTAKQANEIKLKVESILAASLSGLPLDGETAAWIGRVGDDLAAKLAAAGLVVGRKVVSLDAFLSEYIRGRTDAKPKTTTNMQAARRKMVEFFGAEKRLQDITPADADAWVIRLKGQFAEATTARTIKYARQFFTAARRGRLVAANPFEEAKAGSMSNSERLFFVGREVADKILAACPNAEWRLIVALARYGGLRCPSEHLALTWGDVDWEKGRLLIRSSKMEHTASKGKRSIPLFPELRPHLEAAWDDAPEGETYIIRRTRNAGTNWRTQFERIIDKAGVQPWPRLFQNLRASRETELAHDHPMHVVTAWIGNSVQVAAKHYLSVTDADFEKASGGAQSRRTRDAESDAVRSGRELSGDDRRDATCWQCHT